MYANLRIPILFIAKDETLVEMGFSPVFHGGGFCCLHKIVHGGRCLVLFFDQLNEELRMLVFLENSSACNFAVTLSVCAGSHTALAFARFDLEWFPATTYEGLVVFAYVHKIPPSIGIDSHCRRGLKQQTRASAAPYITRYNIIRFFRESQQMFPVL